MLTLTASLAALMLIAVGFAADTAQAQNLPNMDTAKTICADLGFTPGTEKFGECVLRLIGAEVVSPSPAQSPVVVAPPPTPQSRDLSPIVVAPGTRADPIVRSVIAVIEPLLAGIDAVLGVGSPALVEDDEISVHVTLPALQIAFPSGHLSFGDVEFVVTPRADGLYDYDFSISQAIEAFANGSKLAEIYPGNLQIVGTWSVPLQTFTSSQVDINDAWINAGRGADSRLAEIGSLVIQRDMGPGTGGMWNGTFNFALSDVRVFLEDNAALEIGSYTIKNTWDGVDVVGLAELRKKLGLVLPWFEADLEEDVLRDHLEAGISLEWGRGNWTSSITDFLVRDEGQDYHLGAAELRFGYDLTEELGEVSVGLTVGEFELELGQLADIPRELWPHRLSLDVALTQLPLKALLSEIVLEGLNSFGDFDPGRPELVLSNFEVRSDVLEIIATGAIALTNDSLSPINEFPALGLMPPLSATLDVTIVGLSEAVQIVGANFSNIPDGEIALMALVVLRGAGHPQFDLAQRRVVHQYRVVVSPDGRISVNGVPIDQIWR